MRLATTQTQRHRQNWRPGYRRMISLIVMVIIITGGAGIFLHRSQAAGLLLNPASRGGRMVRTVRAWVNRLTGSPVAGTISGTVFDDLNVNGNKDSGEAGIAGATVTVTDDLGNTVTATTDSSGNYTTASLAGANARVEFTSPSSTYKPTIAGNTTVQFVSLSQAATGVDAGFFNPATACSKPQNNLIVPCWTQGVYNHSTNTNEPVIVSVPYGVENNALVGSSSTYLIKSPAVGSIWGLAYQGSTKTLFLSSVIRRHTDTGPKGLSGLYAYTTDGKTATAKWSLSLNDLVNTFGAALTRDLAANNVRSYDVQAYDSVGKRGIGDIDLTEDGNTLWVVNLNQRSLVKLNVSGGNQPTSATEYTLASASGVPSCTGGVLRPWGLKFANGKGYLGVVCSAETSNQGADLKAFVLSFDPAASGSLAFTTELAINDMLFTRGVPYKIAQASNTWVPWLSTLVYATCGNTTQCARPSPILSDIEFDSGGNMIIGFADRLSLQLAAGNYGLISDQSNPESIYWYTSYSGGDIMRACKDAGGNFVLESGGQCGGVTGSGNTPVGGEFYFDNYGASPTSNHQEVAQGGLALDKSVSPSQVVTVAMDPADTVNSGGLMWLSNVDGSKIKGYNVFKSSGLVVGESGKATGLGDIEIVSGDCSPLPLEIGNRVWNDRNGNGIQDAGETGLDGVVVQLYKSGTLVGTVTTADGGHYIFNDDNVTGGLQASMAYQIRILLTQSVIADSSFVPTTANADASTGGDLRDSDATLSGTTAVIDVTTGALGTINHNSDFGFTQQVSIGNQVFYDANNNGLRASDEYGINGVVVELFADANMDGQPDTANPLARVTTASANGVDGLYLFNQQTLNPTTGAALTTPLNLGSGKYIVCLPASNFASGGKLFGLYSSGTTSGLTGVTTETTAPDPNTGGATSNPGIDNDDNGYLATNKVLSRTIDVSGNEPLSENPNNDPTTKDSLENLTVDFGFYSLSIGNLVFEDSGTGDDFGNGIRDSGEPGLSGVTVSLYAEDGTTLIATKTTDSDGRYLFPMLAAGKYYVEVVSASLPRPLSSSPNIPTASNPKAADNDDNGVTASTTGVRSAQIMLTPADSSATGESDHALSLDPGFNNPRMPDNPLTPDSNSLLKVDFGFLESYSIGNQVFYDANNNSVKDTGEPGINGVLVELYADSNMDGQPDTAYPLASQVTASVGNEPGLYLFDAQTINPATGQELSPQRALLAGKYLVCIPSANFTGSGALVGLYSSGTTAGTTGTTAETTPADPNIGGAANNPGVDSDDNGYLSASKVISKTIDLGTNEPLSETPDNDLQTADNSENLTVDFGFYGLSIGNLVFLDMGDGANYDNAQVDSGEQGILGVRVELYAEDGTTLLQSKVTDENGKYLFTGLVAGKYTVKVVHPKAMKSSTDGANVTTPNAADGDDNGPLANATSLGVTSVQVMLMPMDSTATGEADQVNASEVGFGSPAMADHPLTPDANSNLKVDFGFISISYSIGNQVFFDTNNNSLRDAGEPGINGVTVELYADADMNGQPDTALPLSRQLTYSYNGVAGLYLFFEQTLDTTTGSPLADSILLTPGKFIVCLPASNFAPGGPLFGLYSSATTAGTNAVLSETSPIDPNLQGSGTNPGIDSDDNGLTASGKVISATVDLGTNEPLGESPDNDGFTLNYRENLTVDFGFYALSLGNLVFSDTGAGANANNGLRDAGEPGLAGVTVRLLAEDGVTILATKTTDADGRYLFPMLAAGKYCVEVLLNSIPAGMVSSFDGVNAGTPTTADSDDNGILVTATSVRSAKVMLTPGDSAATGESDQSLSSTPGFGSPPMSDPAGMPDANSNLKVDFGFARYYSLGNRVWKDTNRNGLLDAGESGVSGVVLRLLKAGSLTQATDISGALVADQITTVDGYYRFDNLGGGDYVVEVLAANFTSTGALFGCASSQVDAGDPDTDADDNDDNGAGGTPSVSTGIRSLTVTLGDGNSTQEPTTEVDPAGNPLAGEAPDNQSNRTVDFGFVPIFYLGNRVWKDLNNNGLIDAGESGIDGVVVKLNAWVSNQLQPALNADGQTVANLTTAGGGYYRFDNLLPGDYVVEIVTSNFTGSGALVGCYTSTGSAGTPGTNGSYEMAPDEDTSAVDSDDNGTLEGSVVRSKPVTLGPLATEPAGETDLGPGDGSKQDLAANYQVDFGFTSLVSVGNLVWKDENYNGLKDSSEPGIANVTLGIIYDVNANGTFDDGTDVVGTPTATTNSSGIYQFTNLLPGKYFVRVAASNFASGGAIEGCISSINATPVPADNDIDNDDNGVDSNNPTLSGVLSTVVMLVVNGEPTNDGDGDDSNLTVDFGFIRGFHLGNRVWKDANNNGLQDAGEAGIDGVVVKLYAWSGSQLQAANNARGQAVTNLTTAGGGYYRFDDLLPGDYVVEIVAANFSGSGALVGCYTSTGSSGIIGSSGPYEMAPDEDTTPTDRDDNGTLDAASQSIRSKPVTLGAPGEPLNETDLGPNDGLYPDTVSNYQVDFGFVTPMVLGNLVWKDYDNDQLRDLSAPAEPGVAGVTLQIYNDVNLNGIYESGTDTPGATATTDANGNYLFSNLLPGKYFVAVTAGNFAVSGPLAGCLSSLDFTLPMPDGDVDNDDNGQDAATPAVSGVISKVIMLVNLAEPTTDGDGANGNLTLDFGFIPPTMKLGNLVWKDLNENGLRDANEPPIPGVKVLLYRDANRNGQIDVGTDPMSMTTTDANGLYCFVDLIPDKYFVRIDTSNFNAGSPLYNLTTTRPTTMGDTDIDNDDNGSNPVNANLSKFDPATAMVRLIAYNEPTNDSDGNNNTNLSIDFGFLVLNKLKIGDPAICVAPGGVIEVVVDVVNAGDYTQQNNPGSELQINMPANVVAVLSAVSKTNSSGPGTVTIVGTNQILWNGSLLPGDQLVVTYRVQIGDYQPGTIFCTTSSAFFDGDLNGTNETQTDIEVCTVLNCPPLGPGNVMPSSAFIADHKPGSVLIYNLYTSTANTDRQNTQFNLTNAHPLLPANVHLFFVDGSTCAVADQYVSLTPAQTTTFYASDLDPGTTGYVIAVAVDEHGCPANFNFLIGDEYVWFESGHAANLPAVAVAGLPGGLPLCDTTSTTATLNFDGIAYNQLPRALALDSISSRADGNDTMIIVNRMGGNLLSTASTLGSFFGLLYDDQEVAASFNIPGGTCQLRGSLSNSLPRTAPRFETMIPAGRVGWMKFWQVSDVPITGAAIRYRATGARQGHNLHMLTASSTGSFTIPVFPVP